MKYFNPPRDNLKGKQKDIMDQSKKIASFDKYWFWYGLWHSHQSLRKQGIPGSVDDNNRRLRHLKLQILLHYFLNFFYFPIFLFKFLLPSFMKGKNNVWKNIKTIIKEKEFKPLRIAILSQLVFTLILTQLGILVYQYYTNPSRTATMFLTQTNWGGGASTTLSASHSSDQTGWSSFFSTSSADVDTSVSGQISVSPTLSSTTQTTDSDFNSWSKPSNVYVPTGGNKITLLKPNGASCTQASQCSSSFCSGGLCAIPPCGLGVTSTVYSGETYPVVNIGTQCWFAKNLNVGTMVSGSVIPSNGSVTEKWCYNDSAANCTTYGGLYLYAELSCPSGWHIPTNAQFNTLIAYVGANPGTQLKTGGSSGFNALLGGYRQTNTPVFIYLGTYGYFWTATDTGTFGYKHCLYFNTGSTVSYISYGCYIYNTGSYARCLKN